MERIDKKWRQLSEDRWFPTKKQNKKCANVNNKLTLGSPKDINTKNVKECNSKINPHKHKV